MAIFPDLSAPGSLKDLASLATLLVAASNLGFVYGSRRKLGSEIDEHRTATKEQVSSLRSHVDSQVSDLWSESKECRDDRRALAEALAKIESRGRYP